jgi:hypothetical protein
MGDTFFCIKPNNLTDLVFYCNLQLIHNVLINWPGSIHPCIPTNVEEIILRNGLEELQVGSAKQGF